MTAHRFRSHRFVAWLLIWIVGLAASSPLLADGVDPWDGNWHYSVTPYGWLPGVSAKLRFRVQNQAVDNQSDGSILDNLSGAFMLAADARKGRWGIYTDIDWVKFSDQKGRFASIGNQHFGVSANLRDRWGLQGGMANLAGMYNLGHGDLGYADLLVGARYVWIKGNLRWNFALTGNRTGETLLAINGRLAGQTHITNGFVGIKGRWTPFRNRFFVPYYLDIGTNGTASSGQAVLGAGYAFSWGGVALAWRYVRYIEQHNKLLRNVDLSGPCVMLNLRF